MPPRFGSQRTKDLHTGVPFEMCNFSYEGLCGTPRALSRRTWWVFPHALRDGPQGMPHNRRVLGTHPEGSFRLFAKPP